MSVDPPRRLGHGRHHHRRRRQDKGPVPVTLVFDDDLRGDVGILSDDLLAELFPHHDRPSSPQPDAAASSRYYYVAITPAAPDAAPTTAVWSLVPVIRAPASAAPLPASTLRFSPTSSALQSLALHLRATAAAPSRAAPRPGQARHGIDVLVLDAAPLPLSVVYIKVDADLARRLERGDGTFYYGDRPAGAARADVAAALSPEDRLAAALRIAIGGLDVIHAGDLVPLPLPPHPVTHVGPNPGRIVLCEPVAQGVLAPDTRVVVVAAGGRGTARRQTRGASLGPPPPPQQLPLGVGGGGGVGGIGVEDDEGTSTEFYSATEETGRAAEEPEPEPQLKQEPVAESGEDEDTSSLDSEHSLSHDDDPDEHDEEEDDEEDEMDDLISLEMPSLPPPPTASGASTAQAGTPRAGSLPLPRTNGTSTPGSVFSALTATTVRPGADGAARGRLFKARGLLRPLPPGLLYPRPAAEDDEEAFVYVDISCLPRIGCFSGDWVRVEAAEEEEGEASLLLPLPPPPPSSSSLPADGSGRLLTGSSSHHSLGRRDDGGEPPNWRPARVFGLPQGYGARPMTRIPSSRHDRPGGGPAERRPSFLEAQIRQRRRLSGAPFAYASPIFLANLDTTPCLRISPLERAGQRHPHHHTQHHRPIRGRLGSGVTSRPPCAREIGLHPIRSQLSVDRAYQTAVLGGLKRYFAGKVRIVRAGDLVAVPVDTQLGRALQEGGGGGGATGTEVDDVVALLAATAAVTDRHSDAGATPSPDAVAWFRIGRVYSQAQAHGNGAVAADAEDDEGHANDDPWASVVGFDAASARMNVSGAERSRIPAAADSSWQQYLGLRPPPISSSPSASSSSVPSSGPVSPVLPSEHGQEYVSLVRRRLRELLAAATSPRAVGLGAPPIAVLLTSSHRAVGKMTAALDACADVGLHAYVIDAHDVLTEPEGAGGGAGGAGGSGPNSGGGTVVDVKTHGLLQARADRGLACGPECCALLVRHVDALAGERAAASLIEILDRARVLVATANQVDRLPDPVRALFTHELEISAPDEAERAAILRTVLDRRGLSLDPAVDLGAVALKTAALVAGDLVDVVDRAAVARCSRLEALAASGSVTVRDVQLAGGAAVTSLGGADLDLAVDAARRNFSDAIGAPKIPNVSWDDVGGLGAVRDVITESIQLPLERPELFAPGLRRRSGLLFYGPPGTGKTLLAKAIATEYSLNFFSVKGPELLNMYVGESEANVRRVFARARDARPCVVFFDELDSVAPKRGNQGDSGGVMDRIVSQLLAELDGMSSTGEGSSGSGGVFVVGATNRPDLLDPALLRPGRFDKLLYLGVSDTHEKQVRILEALTRKFDLDPSVSLAAIADRLPLTYTGADFYALCSDAMLKAVTRQASAVDAKIRAMDADRPAGTAPLSTAAFFDQHAGPDDVAVHVTEADFAAAQRELVPSVSATELAHYERVRASFEGSRQQQQQQQQRRRTQSSRGKGKARAVATDASSGDEDGDHDDDDDGDNNNNNSAGVGGAETESETIRRSKGKGKAVAVFGGGHGASDDDELY